MDQLELLATIFNELHDDFTTNNDMFLLVDGDPVSTVRQLGVLDSEVNELLKAIRDHDAIELFDGIGDVAFVIGTLERIQPLLYHKYNSVVEAYKALFEALDLVNGNEYDIIMDSIKVAMIGNLTKYDESLEAAQLTADTYLSKGIPTAIRELGNDRDGYSGKYVVVSTITDPDLDVVEGKVLKSITRYTTPDFKSVADKYVIRWGVYYHNKVRLELNDIQYKYERLSSFINRGDANALTDEIYHLLRDQMTAMEQYIKVLESRFWNGVVS